MGVLGARVGPRLENNNLDKLVISATLHMDLFGSFPVPLLGKDPFGHRSCDPPETKAKENEKNTNTIDHACSDDYLKEIVDKDEGMKDILRYHTVLIFHREEIFLESFKRNTMS